MAPPNTPLPPVTRARLMAIGWVWRRAGLRPETPPRGVAPWVPTKGSGPWNDSCWLRDRRGPAETFQHPSRPSPIPQPMDLRQRLSPLPEVQEAEPPGGFQGEALTLVQPQTPRSRVEHHGGAAGQNWAFSGAQAEFIHCGRVVAGQPRGGHLQIVH